MLLSIKTHITLSLFLSGMILMMFELAGARIIAPYYGTSIYIWTSVIGVIMGSLSIGYWYGGILADKNPVVLINKMAHILLIISFMLMAVALLKGFVLEIFSHHITDIRFGALCSAFVLFAVPSFLFGSLSPIGIKVLTKNLEEVGGVSGQLYAISTLGSIVGTFLAGFYFIPAFGINHTLELSAFLILIAVYLIRIDKQTILLGGLILGLIVFAFIRPKAAGYKQLETAFHHVKIYNTTDKQTNKEIKVLRLNNYTSAAVFLDSDELVYDYLKFYRIGELIQPKLQHTLMIGGSVCTFPKDLLNRHRDVKVDVIEIDEELIQIAHEDFGLPTNNRLQFFYEDARTYLNRNTKKYDMIYSDAFVTATDLPYQLTTHEAVQKCSEILTDSGAYILNVISALSPDKREFLDKQFNTCKSIFPFVYLFQVAPTIDFDQLQSVCLVSTKLPLMLEKSIPKEHFYFERLITKQVTNTDIFTDDQIDYLPY